MATGSTATTCDDDNWDVGSSARRTRRHDRLRVRLRQPLPRLVELGHGAATAFHHDGIHCFTGREERDAAALQRDLHLRQSVRRGRGQPTATVFIGAASTRAPPAATAPRPSTSSTTSSARRTTTPGDGTRTSRPAATSTSTTTRSSAPSNATEQAARRLSIGGPRSTFENNLLDDCEHRSSDVDSRGRRSPPANPTTTSTPTAAAMRSPAELASSRYSASVQILKLAIVRKWRRRRARHTAPHVRPDSAATARSQAGSPARRAPATNLNSIVQRAA